MEEKKDSKIIVISNEITSELTEMVIDRIATINREDENIEANIKEYIREPIELYINSNGGSMHDGFAIVGAIEMSVTPIVTIVVGQAMSMALAIAMAGHKRYAHRLSTFMYHQISYEQRGTLLEHIRSKEQIERWQKMYDDYILSRSRISKVKLKETQNEINEWFITSEEALNLGIIDSLITVD